MEQYSDKYTISYDKLVANRKKWGKIKDKSKNGRKRIAKAVRLWRQKNPLKIRAQRIIFTELRASRIKRMPCVVCGNENSQAHHPDYNKPLNVVWLCKPHHLELHNSH